MSEPSVRKSAKLSCPFFQIIRTQGNFGLDSIMREMPFLQVSVPQVPVNLVFDAGDGGCLASAYLL